MLLECDEGKLCRSGVLCAGGPGKGTGEEQCDK